MTDHDYTTGNKAEKISLIIPVYEEGNISGFLSNILKMDSPVPVEIIVIDGSPSSSTVIEIDDERIITASAPAGRAGQMNRGAETASGTILVFLHADTVLPEDAFYKISESASVNNYAAGAFRLGINSRKIRYRFIEKAVQIRTSLTSIPYGDQAIFIRKEIFDEIGGFSSIPLMEDIDLMRKIKSCRHSIKLLKSEVYTSPRRWEEHGIIRTTLLNWYIQFRYLTGADTHILHSLYYRGRQ